MGAGVNSITQRQYPAFMTATAHYPPAVETQETAQAPSSEGSNFLACVESVMHQLMS